MKTLSRRDLLKTGLLAPAVAAAHGASPLSAAIQAVAETSTPSAATRRDSEMPGGGRERLLLDFGWRFHFGDANDR